MKATFNIPCELLGVIRRSSEGCCTKIGGKVEFLEKSMTPLKSSRRSPNLLWYVKRNGRRRISVSLNRSSSCGLPHRHPGCVTATDCSSERLDSSCPPWKLPVDYRPYMQSVVIRRLRSQATPRCTSTTSPHPSSLRPTDRLLSHSIRGMRPRAISVAFSRQTVSSDR